ncbi:SAM-dependent methyltransferase [Saccharothrix longispora]|uniref:Protein involved in plasmid replication-relaxation n=1 Tax=Saccharothrix longispora TaxID=33920 RepID=A0ABU1PTR7_9PSEU|nr:SAM-dependent methyltransferase [Saccharothrix longispora]MDR6593514.1 hypothetical protein [Saccharothrix longispora]
MNTTTHRILMVLAKTGGRGLTGPEIQQRTGINAGVGHLHLMRLVTVGLVTRTRRPRHPGAPRRCLYRVTDLGRAEGRQLELLPPLRARRALPTLRSLVDRHATPPGRGDDSSPPDAFGTRWPHPVLLRNHLLGGTLHRPIDKLEALRLRERDPAVDTRARTVEAHRGHVLRTLADHGLVEQVLDLSTGVPAHGVVCCAHVALEDDTSPIPVVYVVTDKHLAAATRAAIGDHPRVGLLVANPCDARTVWRAVTRLDEEHPRRLIHPGRPVVLDALTISDLVPDPRRLRAVLRAWRATVREDSLLLLAGSPDPALPDPLPIARRAGWQRLPGIVPLPSVIHAGMDHRTRISVLTTGRRRSSGRTA